LPRDKRRAGVGEDGRKRDGQQKTLVQITEHGDYAGPRGRQKQDKKHAVES